jgi:spoIIIJ-associated protein
MSDGLAPDDDRAPEDDPAELLLELLEEVADGLGLDCEVTVEEGDGVLSGCFEGTDMGLLTSRRGQALDAIQHLAQRIVFREYPAQTRIAVDAGGYREQRARVLHADADAAAEEASRSGRPVELEAMPASERRIVHEHLRDRDDVQTHSEGDEPERYLVVSPQR